MFSVGVVLTLSNVPSVPGRGPHDIGRKLDLYCVDFVMRRLRTIAETGCLGHGSNKLNSPGRVAIAPHPHTAPACRVELGSWGAGGTGGHAGMASIAPCLTQRISDLAAPGRNNLMKCEYQIGLLY